MRPQFSLNLIFVLEWVNYDQDRIISHKVPTSMNKVIVSSHTICGSLFQGNRILTYIILNIPYLKAIQLPMNT